MFSRKCYLTTKSPSTISNIAEDGIPKKYKGVTPSNQESELGYKNFSLIENFIQEIDWLFLSSSGHRRINISFNNNTPKFDWLIP